MLLAGDIGGTKTTLAIYAPERGLRSPVAMATFPSAQYPSLEALAHVFLQQEGISVDRACFGVAGPIVEGYATITNLPWQMSEDSLRQELGVRSVRLLNDLEAIAHAVPSLLPGDLRTLNIGQLVIDGAVAVIAPGTGLGEAFITRGRPGYQVFPSEGGHTDFGPTNALQAGLLTYLLQRYEHVSYERVCSGGLGVPNLYDYLKAAEVAPEATWLVERLAVAHDPTPVIADAALDASAPDALALATMRLFISILGAEAGNLALKVLATGGVYIGGGIPPRILPLFEDDAFLHAFTNKGRFAELLSHIPVHIILHPDVALLGAATYALSGAG
jgi:glucokinase